MKPNNPLVHEPHVRYYWQLERIGELPPQDQRDGLLGLLPSWRDRAVQHGEKGLRDEA